MGNSVVALKELGEFKNGANYPKGSYGAGNKIVNVKDLFRGRFVPFNGLDELKPGTLKNKDIYLVEDGDLLFTRSSLVKSGSGMVAMINNPLEDILFCGFIIRFRPNKSKVLPLYLLYLLRSPKYRKLFTDSAVQTNISNINQETLGNILIDLPNFSTQQKIAAVLSALDAKIELNARINAELESMAKTLYDYWFVQKKVESWKVGKLGDVLKIYLGGTPSTKNPEYWENATIPWLNSGDLTEFPIIISSSFVTQKGVDNSATTILPKGSVVISLVRDIRPSIITMEACANQSVVGILETEDLKNSFIYPYLVNEVPRLMSLRTGAQQPHINKEVIDETLLYIPPKHILKEYYKVAEPIYKKIINLAFESQTLTELRDWLLPMLMNGQVRVG